MSKVWQHWIQKSVRQTGVHVSKLRSAATGGITVAWLVRTKLESLLLIWEIIFAANNYSKDITCQTAKWRNNNRNIECLLCTCLRKGPGAHPWLKTPSIGYPRPCWGQMDRVWRNYRGWGTQGLVLWIRLETAVLGGMQCTERSCGEYHQMYSHLRQA